MANDSNAGNRRLTIVSSLPGSLLPRPRVESASSPPQDRLSESDISESGRLNLFTEPVEQLQNIDKEPLSLTESDLTPADEEGELLFGLACPQDSLDTIPNRSDIHLVKDNADKQERGKSRVEGSKKKANERNNGAGFNLSTVSRRNRQMRGRKHKTRLMTDINRTAGAVTLDSALVAPSGQSPPSQGAFQGVNVVEDLDAEEGEGAGTYLHQENRHKQASEKW